ncbi:MAG: ferric reductase-like transmembrane domain-containing protein, partial [Acidimicrobiia bacterium]|nr:ferric reductase-like transmembrane domain-containing protein [Acidimicrobiia bacterium]
MSLEWMLIRGSGLVAFLLLAASVLWGLVLSLGLLPRSVKNLTLLHESLSVGALLATLVHMVGIGLDEFIDFDAAAVLVPGRAPFRPLAVSWGVAAFYGLVVVILSFYIRKQIGQSIWRNLHYISFGVFLSALIHGLTAGTDTANPLVFALYAATAAAVVVLVVLRIVMAGAGDKKASPAASRTARPAPEPTPAAPAPEQVAEAAPAATTEPATERRRRIPAEVLERAAAARAAKAGGQPVA